MDHHTAVTTNHPSSTPTCAILLHERTPVAPLSDSQTTSCAGRQTKQAKPSPPPSPSAVSNGPSSGLSHGESSASRGASGKSSEERQSTEPRRTEGYAALSLSQAEAERARNGEHRKMLRGLATCPYCRGLFEGMAGLQGHLDTFDMCRRLSLKDNEARTCDECGTAVCVGAVSLTAHKMKEHFHPGVAAQCPYCEKAELGLGGLAHHLKNNKWCERYQARDQEVLRCEGCGHQCVGAAVMVHHRHECTARPAGMPLLCDLEDVSAFCGFQPRYLWCPCCNGRFGDMDQLRQHFAISAQCGAAERDDSECISCERCGAGGLSRASLWEHLCEWQKCQEHYGGLKVALSAMMLATK